jgi:hypothetical protein
MAGSFDFNGIFVALESAGIMVFLVFLLVFTIIFAVLEKTKIMGEAKKNLNVALALIFALLFVIPHATGSYPADYDPVQIVIDALPQVSLIVVAVIALMILIGVFAHDRIMFGLSAPGWIGLFSVVAIIVIFGGAAGWWTTSFMDWLEDTFGENILAVVIMILVFGIVIAFVTGGEERGKVGALERIGLNLPQLFGGKR